METSAFKLGHIRHQALVYGLMVVLAWAQVFSALTWVKQAPDSSMGWMTDICYSHGPYGDTTQKSPLTDHCQSCLTACGLAPAPNHDVLGSWAQALSHERPVVFSKYITRFTLSRPHGHAPPLFA